MNGNVVNTLLLVLAAVTFSAGGVCMKWSAGLTHLWATTCMLLLFCTGAGLQALAMREAELGVAYILVLGGEVVLTLVFSVFLLGETCSPARIAAASLIVCGMVWLRTT